MSRLDVQGLLPRTDVTLRSPPNWTAVLFFAGLASLHLYLATSAFLHHRWEGFMSLIFGLGFSGVSLACWLVCSDVTILAGERRLRLRTGVRRLCLERSVPFAQVRSVRLTLLHPRQPTSARIELVCDREVIECPPTCVPREEALCLAVTMGCRLVKVYGDAFGPVAERLDKLPSA
ncbi:MAG TPA: hypothetical protein VER17_04740 [Tepidisphaeraceae bacterium]|nr:hypothetical protein [Tepidisphaeraceae bacterium]